MIDGRRGSYGSKVNCLDTGYEEIYAWKGKYPDVCSMVPICNNFVSCAINEGCNTTRSGFLGIVKASNFVGIIASFTSYVLDGTNYTFHDGVTHVHTPVSPR